MKKRDLILDEYNISKHRYRELYNFCLQYPEWKAEKSRCYSYGAVKHDGMPRGRHISDPTARNAERSMELDEKMHLIEQTAIEADSELYQWIIKGVTEGIGYDTLMPPCGLHQFNKARRRFFYLLDLKKK